jgi:isopentenyl diphosphate isomerase/L-lactate dehydrogenase-like FMN-dependent dehydrogenase
MTKEQLELKVKELTAALTQFETDQASLKSQLDKAKSDLEDINKPVITKETVENIRQAVADAVGHFSFDEVDNYEYDIEINYNNRVQLSNIELNYTDDLEESICNEIEDLFKIEEDE